MQNHICRCQNKLKQLPAQHIAASAEANVEKCFVVKRSCFSLFSSIFNQKTLQFCSTKYPAGNISKYSSKFVHKQNKMHSKWISCVVCKKKLLVLEKNSWSQSSKTCTIHANAFIYDDSIAHIRQKGLCCWLFSSRKHKNNKFIQKRRKCVRVFNIY